MLTHGVLGVVPRLRRSLPRRAKRRNKSVPAGTSPSCARERTKRPPTKPIAPACIAPTHPPAETDGALKASKRRHNCPQEQIKCARHPPQTPRLGKTARAGTRRLLGVPASSKPRRGDTTPRTPGVSPGTSLTPKTNPSLGEAAQSPAKSEALRQLCRDSGTRSRDARERRNKSAPAGTRPSRAPRIRVFDTSENARATSSFPQKKKRPRGKTLRGRVFSPRVFQDAAAGGFPLPPLCGRAPELPGRGPRPRRERRLPPRNSRPALPSRFSFRAPSP